MDRGGWPSGHPPVLKIQTVATQSPYSPYTGDTDSPISASASTRNLIPPPRVDTRNRATTPDSLLTPDAAREPRDYFDISPTTPSSEFHARRSSFASSRRNSTESGRDPFATSFDSRPASPTDSLDDVNTQTVAQMYNINPSADLIVYPGESEKDDYLHNPGPDDHKRDCNIWTGRGMVNLGGMLLMFGAMLMFMVGWPALTYARKKFFPPSLCSADVDCLSDNVPLLKNLRTGLVDPDTPSSAMSKTAKDGTNLKLVFSDEFNVDGRTFYDGDDPYWEAVDIWYGVTEDIEWYDPDSVSTAGGSLNIKFDAFQNHNLNYRSGMVQSWNKLCFTGGRMEASISLPGRGDISGFWPGFWAMGNLGRPGYPATTDGMWPYSYYDGCDAGITPNQSATDGLSYLPGMRLPACTCAGEDHPSAGNSRSAPEIDAIEASVGYLGPGPFDGATGSASQSFQAAPFDIWYQPDYDYVEVYDNEVTMMNTYRGGPYQEAVSGLTWLNNDWYDGKAYQAYGFEYEPGSKGQITWFTGDSYTWKIDARAMRPNGNIGLRVIPTEPMSLVMNFGMSNSFAKLFLANLAPLLPATMRFDYVRIYQEEGSESITCDPEDYPTTAYIKKHNSAYTNQNLTNWAKADYDWPKNSLMNGCST